MSNLQTIQLPNEIFNLFFTDKETRKNFNISQINLIRTYPQIFKWKYNIIDGKKRKRISFIPDKEEQARNILKNHYLPYLEKDGKVNISQIKTQYTTKAGETKTYVNKHITVLHPNTKFKELDENQAYQDLIKNSDKTTQQKVDEIYYSPDFPKNIEYKALYGYVYRKSKK